MGAGRANLAPAMLTSLACADAKLGTPVPVTSGFRTEAEQQALREHPQGFPVAQGTSKHQLGLAIDVPLSFVPRLLTVASSCGLTHPMPASDPVHFEAAGDAVTGVATGSASSGTATGLATSTNPWTTISHAVGALGSGAFWIRVLEVVGGIIAMWVGLRVLASSMKSGPAAAAVSSVKGAVA